MTNGCASTGSGCKQGSAILITRDDLTLIPAWLDNCINYKVWDVFTHLFPSINTEAVEVREWISYFIQQFTGHVYSYPLLELKVIHSGKMGQGSKTICFSQTSSKSKLVDCLSKAEIHLTVIPPSIRVVLVISSDMLTLNIRLIYRLHPVLTHGGLVTPLGNIDMSQHWLRQWHVAWRY